MGDLKSFTGMMAPVLTPMDSEGELNLSILEAYGEYLWKNGVKGIYVCGTAGEGVSLTVDERKAVAEEWVRISKKYPFKIIIMVGTGALRPSQMLAKHAESLKVDGIATICPLYDKPKTSEELAEYCKELANAAPKTPFYYYHIPFKTDLTIPMDEFFEVASKMIPTLAGMKYTANDIAGEGLRCLELENRKFQIFSGFDQNLCESLKLGYKTAINGCFNILPKVAGKMYELALSEGDKCWNEMEAQQKIINETLETVYSYTNGFSITSVKAAMKILTGIDVGPPRKPMRTLPSEELASMERKLKTLTDN